MLEDALGLLCILLVAWAPGLALLFWIWRITDHVNRIGARLNQVADHVRLHCASDQQLRQVLAEQSEEIRERIAALHRAAIAHEEGRPWLS